VLSQDADRAEQEVFALVGRLSKPGRPVTGRRTARSTRTTRSASSSNRSDG